METVEKQHQHLQRASLRGIVLEEDFVDDLILLDKIDEETISEHLSLRYHNKRLYTYIGPVLIAINPYVVLKVNGLSIYDMSILPIFSGRQMHEVAPHPFAMAESAYSSLMRHFENQCILITGESGSGKTETSKHILEYVVTVSTKQRITKRRMSQIQLQQADETVMNIKHVLLAANPVLEAFGNAQTIRNNNSSRFGKYILLQLNYTGQVVGGAISTYLLEKSRVFRQALGERNFHVFYQLLAGATEHQKTVYDLMTAKQYNYLEHGNMAIDGVSDVDQHTIVQDSMRIIGFTAEEMSDIYQHVASVLWLGNITFQKSNPQTCTIENQEAASMVAELLGLSTTSLEHILTHRTIVVARRKESHVVPLDQEQAAKVRDSLAKSLYENLFLWLVDRINRVIQLTSGEHSSSIGILDIYGFEIFECNAFEQLCINYVNEKLQQLFIANTLQVEQEEYRKEGVGWETVAYFNNQIVCDLIENINPPGIFPLLDEQCIISDFSPDTLLNRFHRQYQAHAHYEKPLISGSTFSILHYAGTVEYDVSFFIETNVDTMFNDIHDGMAQSSNAFSRQLFLDNRSSDDKLKRPPTTSVQFRQQVNSLIEQLNQSNPHYVRCIKPNEEKKPMVIDMEPFRHQVRYLGLVENLRVRRAGYCYRETYAKFIHRFKMLSNETWPNPTQPTCREAVSVLLSSPELGVEQTDDHGNTRFLPFEENSKEEGCYALGRTVVFIRYPNGLFALENLRLEAIPKIVKIIERAFRRYKIRLKLFYITTAYNELKSKFDAVDSNILHRIMRRPNSKDKATTKQLYEAWHAVSQKLIPSTNSWEKVLEKKENEIPIIWAQSYVRAQNGRRHLQLLKQAVAVFSASWKGLQVRRNMPPEQWQRCRDATLGIRSEFERFMGKKKRRRDSLDREYRGDYIGCYKHSALLDLLEEHGQYKIYFASEVNKVNQRFHAQKRLLIITEGKLFNIKASSIEKPKLRRCIDLNHLSRISLSTLPDNYIILHADTEYDYLFEIEHKTEVVQILRER